MMISSAISKYSRHTKGAAAMEFALVLPLLFLIYIGVIASFDAMRALSQSSRTALILSDLATRVTEMDDDRRDAIFATGNALMPLWEGGSSFSVSITSIINPVEANESDVDVTQEVVWSEASVSGREITTADLANFTIPTIEEGDSIILVEVRGNYSPSLGGMFGLSSSFETTRTSVRRPRFVSEVAYTD